MTTPVKPDSSNSAEATQPQSVLDGREEMDFVANFSKKLADGETPTDRGRAKQERIRDVMTASDDGEDAGKASESKPKDKSKPDNSKPEGTRDDEPGDDPEDDDDKDDDTENGAAADDVDEDEPGDEPKDDEDDVDDDDEDDVDEDDDEAPSETDLAKEAQASLEKHGLKVRLADLPAEARPLVQKTLDHARSVVSRAMAEHTAFRTEKQQFEAEMAFKRAHPALFIAELLEGENGEEIEAKVNELLRGANTDTTKNALAITIRDKRKEVLEGIQSAAARTEKQLQRADAIDAYVRTASTKLGLDYDLVVESVLVKLADKPDDARDLTQQELDAIIGRHQRAKQKLVGEKRQKDRKTEIQGRVRDRKTTSPAAKAGSGNTPAPTGKKPPTNDNEFIEHMGEKLAGSRKAAR